MCCTLQTALHQHVRNGASVAKRAHTHYGRISGATLRYQQEADRCGTEPLACDRTEDAKLRITCTNLLLKQPQQSDLPRDRL
eukprot:7209031-Prymnesium_polylepis.3